MRDVACGRANIPFVRWRCERTACCCCSCMREIPANITQTLDTVGLTRTAGGKRCKVRLWRYLTPFYYTLTVVASYSPLLKYRPVIRVLKHNVRILALHTRVEIVHVWVITICDRNELFKITFELFNVYLPVVCAICRVIQWKLPETRHMCKVPTFIYIYKYTYICNVDLI